jgi:hypothetical protein
VRLEKRCVTWFIYNGGGRGGYSSQTVANYTALAKKSGIDVQVVSDSKAIVKYVNGKTGGSSRSEDPVTSFAYVGHATPGDLDVGWVDHGFWSQMTNATLDVSDFKADAFSSTAVADLVGGCRTAVGGVFSRSVAEQMADKVGGTVLGSDVRVYYPGGVVSNQALVAPNRGSIVEVPGRGGKKQ